MILLESMSAQTFIIVGKTLQAELAEHVVFNNYFSKAEQYKLVNIDSIDQFDFTIDLTSTLFIIKHFDGEIFATLSANNCHIMGSTALLQLIRKSLDPIEMVPVKRPLHNLAMQNILITFSGIPDKNEAQQLLTLTRYMGSKSREDVTERTTHLVAGTVRGLKYRRALELGLPIMSKNWVHESYRMSLDDLDFDASEPDIIQSYKLKPFQDLHMAFLGFKDDDLNELIELTNSNGGNVVGTDDSKCSHVVVDAISGFNDTDSRMLGSINQLSSAHIVFKEWFWASLEIEGKANEDSYAVPGFRTLNRRSSRTPTGYRGSFTNILSPTLDYSRSPDSMLTGRPSSLQPSRAKSSVSCLAEDQPDLSKITARHRACLELLQTERNYVRILETIVNLFKLPLENPDQLDPILPMTDVKIIFGNVTPIYEVHKRMLNTLANLIEKDWKETNCIGKVFVANSIEILKAYPPFVNYFEDTKKTIDACDARYPRFHAFLKRCQSKGECNRESLKDMLIRPVQRLPSISLLLTELIKRTEEANPDKKYLTDALTSIRRVMNLINEDKRETEGQIAMFDIVNNIEDCPPNLLSASRKFICKVEAKFLYTHNGHQIKSSPFKIFLFSDLIEICKLRSIKRTLKRTNSSKGNGINRGVSPSTKMVSNKKEYRHLDDLHLCDVMNVYKTADAIVEAIVIRARPTPKYEKNFRYYPIVIEDETISQSSFIEKLENCSVTCAYQEQFAAPIPNDEIDFGFANLLVHSMDGRSRLSRVLSIRQTLTFPLTPHK